MNEADFDRMNSFTKLHVEDDGCVDFFLDDEVSRHVFARRKPLVRYYGAAGKFLNQFLLREEFISLEGRDESVRTMWLVDMSWRAIRKNRKVAFLSVSGTTEDEIRSKFSMRGARRPLRDLLRIICFPISAVSIRGIESVLFDLSSKGWNPDVVVIDLFSGIAPIREFNSQRESVILTWKKMRAISQYMSCLLLTGVENLSDSDPIDVEDSLPRDRIKYVHVTGAIGLNQTNEEKKLGITRLKWIVLREGPTDAVCRTVGLSAVVNPCMTSSTQLE